MHSVKQMPTGPVRGVREPRSCMVQAGGTLAALVDGQPMAWIDRPLKFRGHVNMMLRKPGRVMTDIRWKQLGSNTWWRIPDWPEGEAHG